MCYEILEVTVSDMKWAYQLEIENEPTIELKSGTEHYFNGRLESVTHKEAVLQLGFAKMSPFIKLRKYDKPTAKRNKLIITISDPAVSRKASIAIRSLGKFSLSFNGESHRKFFFHLKDGDSFQVGTKKVLITANFRGQFFFR